ncbi:MAG: thioredoxin family protein [Arcobacteraceae bacterium]
MKTVTSVDEINQYIQNNTFVLLYFSGENCAVCKSLKPKIAELFKEHFPTIKLLEVPTDNALETTAFFGVFSLPTILLFVEQKESLRKGRNISLAMFKEEVKRIYELFLESKE